MIVIRLGPRMARSRAGEDGVGAGVLVAFGALESAVIARIDWEPYVVEFSLIPGRIADVVARLTGRWKAGGNVVRVIGLLVVVEMAVNAIRRQTLVGPTRVASVAVLRGVRTNQRPHIVGKLTLLP